MRQVLCPVLVGRERELAELGTALQAARIGRGGLVVVSGEAGIGKSRLARAVVDQARGEGVAVGIGRAVEGTQLPFRPFGEALHWVLRERRPPRDPALSPYQAVLGQFVPEWADHRHPAVEPGLVLLEGIHRLVRALGAEHGLLLVLEDLHWADADTLAAVEYVADNVGSARVLCLVTERSGAPGEAADRLARLVARRAGVQIGLSPLPDEAVAAMAEAALQVESAPAPLVAALRRRADGVPLLVEEMLTAYLAAGGGPHASAEWWIGQRIAESLPRSFRHLVRDRLGSLDEAAASVVNAAAVLGRGFDWPLLGPIARLDADTTLQALRAAAAAQLIVAGDAGFGFRHALVREAVLAELLPPERAELCTRAADVIEDRQPGLPGEWCERAAELREQAGDRQGACRLLQESARRALARGALASAEASLHRARELARGDYVLWMGVDTLLCEVLAWAGKTQDLVALSRGLVAEWERDMRHAPHTSLARMVSAPRRARIHLQAAEAALVGGDLELAAESLDTAGRAAPEDQPTLTRIRSLTAALAYQRDDLESAASHAAAALAAAEPLALPDVTCQSLEILGRIAGAQGDLDEVAARFSHLLTAAGDSEAVWRIRALAELGAIESLRRADADLLEQARALAVETGAVSLLATIEVELGWHRLRLARLDEAGRFIDSALDSCQRFALPDLPDALLARSALHALTGQSLTEAVRQTLDAAAERPDIRAAVHGEAEAVAALVRENRAAARAKLDEAAAARVRWRRGAPWFLGLRELLAAADGEPPTGPPRGHPVLQAYQEYAAAIRYGRAGRRDDAASAVAQADAIMPAGWRRRHAHRIVAEAAVTDGWGDPARSVAEALAFFETAGFSRMADACKRLLRQAGVPARRAGRGDSAVPAALAALGVTSREMDVLALVGEGLSNLEIAERLFLSSRTVETHVKSLMRRAGSTTRAQLVAFAARHTAVGSGSS